MSRIALQTLTKLNRGTDRKSKLVRVLLEMREALCQGMGADCFIGSGFSGRQIWDFSLSVEDIFFLLQKFDFNSKGF